MPAVEESDDCARGDDTSSSRSLRPGHVQAPLRPTGTEDGKVRGGGSRDALHGDVPGASSSPGGDDEPPAASSRPDRLFAVFGPQERVLRQTVEQMADSTPVVPMLEAPVQQLGCNVVGSALGRWEPLPPHARVQPALELASPRPGPAGGCQASHGDAGDGLVRGSSESLYSHVGRDALHRVADALVSGA